MGQSGGERGGRRHQAASEAAVAAARHPARRGRLAADAQATCSFGTWHYWWQAHLLDCLVDAQLRDPQPDRETRIKRQIRSHRLRNNGSWVNNYYDDMAWLALALERAGRLAGVERRAR